MNQKLSLVQPFEMKTHIFVIFLILSCFNGILSAHTKLPPCDVTESDEFPKNFIFGAASAAYQVEGAWNASGKGPSIWDTATHNFPGKIDDRTNGDISADSYRHYLQDILALKESGVIFRVPVQKFKFKSGQTS